MDIEQLRRQVHEGTYDVTPERVAEAILEWVSPTEPLPEPTQDTHP